MTIRITDLSSAQIRMLVRLDDGQPHEDSVGRVIGDLNGYEMRTVDSLVRLGLVEFRLGWKLQFWCRLTEAGRHVQEKGWAE